MTLTAKHVPPRGARRFGAVAIALNYAQVVGAAIATTGVRNDVVYLVVLGVVASARALKAGYHFALLCARDVARAAWLGSSRDQNFDQKSAQHNFDGICGQLPHDQNGQRVTGESNEGPPQFFGDQFAATVDGQQNQQKKNADDDVERVVRLHGRNIFRLRRGFWNGTFVPRTAGEA